MISYRSHEGYKNLKIGAVRAVLAYENNICNITFYVYAQTTWMYDITVGRL